MDSSPPPPPQRSRQWKQAGRRVQLAVKSSVHSIKVTKPDFEGDNSNNDEKNAVQTTLNIDAALSSLYNNIDVVHNDMSSSYLPQPHSDWLLDGSLLQKEDAEHAETLFDELHADPMLALMEMLEKGQLEGKDESCKNSDEESEEKKDGEEDDFGDFQSASLVDDDDHESARLQPPPIETHDLATSSSYVLDTPELLELSERVISSLRKTVEQEEAEPSFSDETPLAESSADMMSPSFTAHRTRHATESSSTLPLSLQLPVEDLSTLEARFTRRRQKVLSTKVPVHTTSLEDFDLPPYFFTSATIDDSIKVMESLPWHHVADEQSSNNDTHLDVWDGTITSRLCELDAALAHVHQEQLVQVQPHQTCIEQANQVMHEWEQNLRLAHLYWERSHAAVQQAAGNATDGSGVKGMQSLLVDFKARGDLRALDNVLEELVGIWGKERDLMERIDSYAVARDDYLDDFQSIQELAADVKELSNNGRLRDLNCLVATRENVDCIELRCLQRLHQLARVEMVRFCRRSHDWTHYNRIIVVFHTLNPILQKPGEIASVWAQNMVSSICYEIERALAVALLESDDLNESSYCQELRKLECELDSHWGDSARLRTLTHNLVTIRFNFESKMSHLPRVVGRVCDILLGILHTFCESIEWHMRQEEEESSLGGVASELAKRASDVWCACTRLLAKCLEEYLHFSSRRKLFLQKNSGLCDEPWREDLDNLHEVYSFADGFLSIKREFIEICCSGEVSGEDASFEDSNMMKLTADIARRHLRSVHVEAMNTVGRCLASESWSLSGFDLKSEPERTGPSQGSLEDLIRRARIEATKARVYPQRDSSDSNGIPTNRFARALQRQQSDDPVLPETPNIQDANSSSSCLVREMVESLMQSSKDNPLLAPETVTRVMLRWFARLFSIKHELPLIHDDVADVYINLADLYFTTVLRVCAGSGKSERVLLGADLTSPFLPPTHHLPATTAGLQSNSTAASLFKSFRNAKKNHANVGPSRQQKVVLPSHLNAEICSPVPSECEEMKKVATFIERGQRNLSTIVNLDMVDSWLPDPQAIDTEEEKACEVSLLLSKQEAAITGCALLAVMLDVLSFDAMSMQSPTRHEVTALRMYSTNVLEIVPSLCEAARRISCVRAIDGKGMVKDIVAVGPAWRESNLHSHCNDYVDDLCDRCALVWGYLKVSGKLPDQLLSRIWECIISMTYQSIMEGFSRVPSCSAEGRALMALDLASLASGISETSVFDRLKHTLSVDPPQAVQSQFHRGYVEIYIKAFYYPKSDVLEWIKNNRSNYKINHVLSLVVASLAAGASEDEPLSIPDLLEEVKRVHKGEADTKQYEQSSSDEMSDKPNN